MGHFGLLRVFDHYIGLEVLPSPSICVIGLKRRAMPVVSDADDGDGCTTAPRVGFRQSDSSDDVACGPAKCDASIQDSDWQTFSNQEFENEISFRLSTPSFSMTTDVPIPFRQDYLRPVQYNAAGATYNGTSQTGSMRPARDLRNILTMTPEWIENAEMLKRSMQVHIIRELDRGSSFIRALVRLLDGLSCRELVLYRYRCYVQICGALVMHSS